MKYEQVCALLDKHFVDTIGDDIPAEQFRHQPAVIARAWELLVKPGQTGVVLADEVGLGKTYEALWTLYLYLLDKLGRRGADPRIRVLITVPPNLVEKWRDEVERFAGIVKTLESTAGWKWPQCAQALAKIDELAISDDDLVLKWKKRSVSAKEEGVFLVRPNALIKLGLDQSPLSRPAKLLKQIVWDGFIFDEAHQYAKDSKRAVAVRALCDWAHEKDTRILLCTATPFQLDTSELNNLLSLLEPSEQKQTAIKNAIESYNQSIVALRDAIDLKRVMNLENLRNNASQFKIQLEGLLRGYILRTRRESHDSRVHTPLSVPPGDQFPWAYWDVRDWIRSQSSEMKKRSFVSTTLGMTVSSMESLFTHLEGQAGQHSDNRQVLTAIRQLHMPHPKFSVLTDLVGHLVMKAADALTDINRTQESVANLKCVIFVHYKQTTEAIKDSPAVNDAIAQLDHRIQQAMRARLDTSGVDGKGLKRQMVKELGDTVNSIIDRYDFAPSDPANIWKTAYEAQTNNDTREEQLIKWGAKEDLSQREAGDPSQSIVSMLKRELTIRLNEPWVQLELTKQALQTGNGWLHRLSTVVKDEVDSRLNEGLQRIQTQYYDKGSPVQSRTWLRLRLSRLVYSLVPHSAVEYIVGDVPFPTRQQIINAFNRDLYPLVLVCSSVAEEGIDLQKQCNQVVHYDLEWNPARVEQREGRVDRRGRNSTLPVNVQTIKLADSYDERILKRCENRRLWMDLFLCKAWKEESSGVDSDTIDTRDVVAVNNGLYTWLREYQLDLQPKPIHS